jgi:hypothetical protein
MSASFAHDLLKHMPLTPTTKLLKKPFRTHCPNFRNFICPPFPGKTYHGSLERLYL